MGGMTTLLSFPEAGLLPACMHPIDIPIHNLGEFRQICFLEEIIVFLKAVDLKKKDYLDVSDWIANIYT